MSRLKPLLSWLRAAYELLISTMMGIAALYIVFGLTREATVLNAHLASIEAKMIDPTKPIDVTIEPFKTLDSALHDAPKKGKHK